MRHALRVCLDQHPKIVAAVRPGGATGCTVFSAPEPILVCNTDEPRWWPPFPLAVGSTLTIDIVEDVEDDSSTAPLPEPFSKRDANEAASIPPTTFIGLRLTRGGKSVVAGVGAGVVTLNVTLTQTGRRPTGHLDLHGLDTHSGEHHRWLKERLRPGERVTVEVLESTEVDPPLRTILAREPPRRSGA